MSNHLIDEKIIKIQRESLEIYKEFKRICDKYNLRYFSSGGTTIGAILYNGFIPFDDDMDINMPRSDYEKFKKICKTELPDKLAILDGEINKYTDFHFLKLHNKNTKYTNKLLIKYPKAHCGIFIDTEPIDGSPNDDNTRLKYYKKIDKWRKQDLIRKFNKDYMYEDSMIDLVKNRKLWDLYRIIIKIFPRNYFTKKHLKLFKKYSFNNSDFIAFSLYNISKNNSFAKNLERKYWDSFIETQFEDTTVRVPIGYEKILKRQYGFLPTLETQKNYIPDLHHLDNSVVVFDEK